MPTEGLPFYCNRHKMPIQLEFVDFIEDYEIVWHLWACPKRRWWNRCTWMKVDAGDPSKLTPEEIEEFNSLQEEE